MELFFQAVTIMIVGMSLVFTFLAFVIGGINLAARAFHEKATEDVRPPSVPAGVAEDELTAVVVAAAARFLNGKRR